MMLNAGWSGDRMGSYGQLITSSTDDSRWLREAGLKTPITWLLDHKTGVTASDKLLDVGAGTGWLAAHYKRVGSGPEVVECDVVAERIRPNLTLQDVRALAFADNTFAAVVSSLVLIYIEELQEACNELYRVTRSGGYLVASIMHPFCYRMGEVEDDGSFRVTKVYNLPWKTDELKIAGKVGPFTYYHRPLMRYLNSFAEAGWQFCRLWEWDINMHAYDLAILQLKQAYGPPRTDRVPMFAHFLLRKPCPG